MQPATRAAHQPVCTTSLHHMPLPPPPPPAIYTLNFNKICTRMDSVQMFTRFTQTQMEANNKYSLSEEKNLVPAQTDLPNVLPPLPCALPV